MLLIFYNSGLYGTNPDSNANYLIETDPDFASYRNWLTSDYMLERLKLDPNITQKRLGDGYYEQQYIRDQIMMLTGRYYLANYTDQDKQYKGLMDAGAGVDSNINVNGSNLNVSNDALFQADNDFNVNGVAQNSNTRSDNKSSSAAIGGYASTGSGVGITANASRAKGYANSDSVTYANSQINVGGTTTYDIGNDVNIKGGVINTNRAQGVIGGNVNIESLQDTATYDSKQKNMGFSADIDINGAGSSLSVNGGKSTVNADYKAVGQQSGIFTGDGGFDLEVGGKTTLIGGAITTTDAAVAAGRNNYESLGGIETQDIENSTSYKGDSLSAGVSIGKTAGKPQANMNGIGYGTDGDRDTAITRAGITGIAGNKGITTDNRAEYAGALENGFDATRVNEELGAQTQITQAFDQERRKVKTELNKDEKKLRDEEKAARLIGDNVTANEKLAAADKIQQKSLLFDSITGAIYAPNTNGIAGYTVKAASPYVANQIGEYYKTNEVLNDIDEGNRGERGSAGHILAHAVLGAAVSYATGNDALTGGISAGTGEATAPLLSKFLYGSSDPSKLTAEQKDTISAITSALGVGVGVTTGNASDAANAAETSKVAVENNSILFDDVRKWVDEIVNSSANTYKNSVVRNVVKGGGLAADGVLAVVDAFADSSVMAVHCTVGSKSACDTATEYNQARGVAIGQVLIKMGNGDTGRAIIKSYEDLASGDPAKVKKAQATQIQIFTSLGLSVKVGGNGTPIPIKKTSSTSAGKYSTSTTQAAQRAGSNHPLLEDAIPRNGSRLVVNQGQCPTCGPNSAKMVLDTLGKNVPIETLIKKSPMTDVGIYYTDVRNLLRSQGVDAVALPNRTVNDIARYTAKGTPVIVQIAGKNGFSHFVVVDGITKRYGKSVVAIRDPNNIQYFSPINTFESSFTGNTVIIRSK